MSRLTALPASVALLFLAIHPARAKLLPSQRQFPAPATAGRTFSHWRKRVLPPTLFTARTDTVSSPEFNLNQRGGGRNVRIPIWPVSPIETRRFDCVKGAMIARKREREQEDGAGWLISSLFASFERRAPFRGKIEETMETVDFCDEFLASTFPTESFERSVIGLKLLFPRITRETWNYAVNIGCFLWIYGGIVSESCSNVYVLQGKQFDFLSFAFL